MLAKLFRAPLATWRQCQRRMDEKFLFPSFARTINRERPDYDLQEKRDLMIHMLRLHAEHDTAWLDWPDNQLRHKLVEITMRYFPPEE